MGWYDLFSHFYDRSLEPLYEEQRREAAQALRLEPGHVVLDCPCGTGQSLPGLVAGVTSSGRVLGVDFSQGMLARAQERVTRQGWSQVQLLHSDVHALSLQTLGASVDRLHVFLGLSAFPEWERAFTTLWSLLKPGGRAVVVDVHDANPGFQGKMVNLVARADIRRRTWEPLEKVAVQYERRDLPSLPDHGGQLFLATGVKP